MSIFQRQQADERVFVAAPYVVAILFILMGALPVGFFWSVHLELGLFFVPLFFIALTAESDFTPFGIIALGLFNDMLSETPFGYWGFMFCMFYLFAMGQKNVLQNATWMSHWVSFFILCILTYFSGYLVALMRSDMSVGFGAYFLSVMVTGLCFPLLYLPLTWMSNRTVFQERV